ncbi:MAG: quinoprotein dehydrogenase-associated putative ABC transporter substrate-binding protein [Methyloceanibacter sp.]|uniref:quinoprotein dehydrogenase-associated putative ABC transporter substrate-binding protein n=1 Tax=Methyloceanibacter sp. TaxID=1965321 RepID=UPI003D6CDDC5
MSGRASIGRWVRAGARAIGVGAGALGLVAVLCVAALEEAGANRLLRVCADPDNMPFSNSKEEGFENKLAEFIADRLGDELEYTWFEESTGYVPSTMGQGACDLVMGYAQGTGLIDDTNPYYYTSYVLIYRADDPDLKGVDRLSDKRLKNKRIGLFARTPPASLLAMIGLEDNAKPFETYAGESAAKTAEQMIAEIASGKLDAAILWGPVGGYFAQKADVPLSVVPLVKETAGPSIIYGITLGVRPNEPRFKHEINKVLAENQADINVILRDYNVPILTQEGELIAAGTADR